MRVGRHEAVVVDEPRALGPGRARRGRRRDLDDGLLDLPADVDHSRIGFADSADLLGLAGEHLREAGGAQGRGEVAQRHLRGVRDCPVDRGDDRGFGDPPVGFDERGGADESGGEPDDEDIDDARGHRPADRVDALAELGVHGFADPRADRVAGEGEEDAEDQGHRGEEGDDAGVLHRRGACGEVLDERGEQASGDPADDEADDRTQSHDEALPESEEERTDAEEDDDDVDDDHEAGLAPPLAAASSRSRASENSPSSKLSMVFSFGPPRPASRRIRVVVS